MLLSDSARGAVADIDVFDDNNLGSVSLEMTEWASGDLVFAFVVNGDEVPDLVDVLH